MTTLALELRLLRLRRVVDTICRACAGFLLALLQPTVTEGESVLPSHHVCRKPQTPAEDVPLMTRKKFYILFSFRRAEILNNNREPGRVCVCVRIHLSEGVSVK